MAELKVSVIIPVYNGGEDLHRCLDAIGASSYPVSECILVDDCSTDGMAEKAGTREDVRVISLQQQGGPSIARNHGVKEATGDVVFFIDADVIVHPDTVETGMKILQTEPEIAAVFGSYDDQPGHPSFLSQYRNLFHHWVHQTAQLEATTFWSGCGAVRRKVFNDMGGFNPSISRPSIEDIEFGSRLCQAGYRIRLVKNMQCTHLKCWSFSNMVRTDIQYRGIPWMMLILRNRDVPNDLNIKLNSRMATVLASTWVLVMLGLLLAGRASAVVPGLTFMFACAACSMAASVSRPLSIPAAILALVIPLFLFASAPDPLALVPLALTLLLVWTHLDFYLYVSRNRNFAFALAVIPQQIIFFTGCALSAVLGIVFHLVDKRRGTPAQ